MARPTTSKFSEFAIHVETAVAGTYEFLCGLTSKGLDIQNSTSTTAVPDCADEDLPAWNEEQITAQGMAIKGSGVFTREKSKTVLEWALDGEEKNVRVYPGKANVGDIEYFEGPAILKTIGLQVNRGDRVQQSLDLAFTQKPSKHIKA